MKHIGTGINIWRYNHILLLDTRWTAHHAREGVWALGDEMKNNPENKDLSLGMIYFIQENMGEVSRAAHSRGVSLHFLCFSDIYVLLQQ